MFSKLIAGCTCAFLLSGCAAAPLVMGANLAAGEAVTSATKPQVEVNGFDLARMANWNDRFEEKTTGLTGRKTWSCARGGPGTKICVPETQATESNISRRVIFECTYGSGGMVANMFNRDATTMYCEKS